MGRKEKCRLCGGVSVELAELGICRFCGHEPDPPEKTVTHGEVAAAVAAYLGAGGRIRKLPDQTAPGRYGIRPNAEVRHGIRLVPTDEWAA